MKPSVHTWKFWWKKLYSVKCIPFQQWRPYICPPKPHINNHHSPERQRRKSRNSVPKSYWMNGSHLVIYFCWAKMRWSHLVQKHLPNSETHCAPNSRISFKIVICAITLCWRFVCVLLGIGTWNFTLRCDSKHSLRLLRFSLFTQAVICPNEDCEAALHQRCFNSYVSKQKKCPACKSNWESAE